MNKKRKIKTYFKDADKKREFLSLVSQKTGIPDDIVSDSCCITATGQNELIIENYRSLMEYQSEKLVIQTKQCRVEICGKKLEIVYYAKEEMKIKGKIDYITYKK